MKFIICINNLKELNDSSSYRSGSFLQPTHLCCNFSIIRLAIVAIIKEYQFSKIIKQKSRTAHSKNHPAGSSNALRSITGLSLFKKRYFPDFLNVIRIWLEFMYIGL